MDSGDLCIALWMNLVFLSCALQRVNVVTLCVCFTVMRRDWMDEWMDGWENKMSPGLMAFRKLFRV